MMFQQDPFGSLPQFGGQEWQPPMAGGGFGGNDFGGAFGGGFGGMMGGGMFGSPGKKKKGGFQMSPLMLSPLAYAFSKDPKIGLAMMSPGIGIANLLGAFK